MNNIHFHHTRFLLGSTLLLAALLIGSVPGAQAQALFDVQYSDDFIAEMKEREEPMNADMLLGLLAREGRVIYEGEEPVRVQPIVFIVGADGEKRERIAGEPFELEPGQHSLGELLPNTLLPNTKDPALLEEMFPGDEFFPGDTFGQGSGDRLLDEVSKLLSGLEEGVAVVLAVVPTDQELAAQSKVRPAVFTFEAQ